MKLVLLSIVAALASSTVLKDIFTQWKLRHEVSYETALEERYRFSVFAANYAEVLEGFMESPIADIMLTQEKYECRDNSDILNTFCFI